MINHHLTTSSFIENTHVIVEDESAKNHKALGCRYFHIKIIAENSYVVLALCGTV